MSKRRTIKCVEKIESTTIRCIFEKPLDLDLDEIISITKGNGTPLYDNSLIVKCGDDTIDQQPKVLNNNKSDNVERSLSVYDHQFSAPAVAELLNMNIDDVNESLKDTKSKSYDVIRRGLINTCTYIADRARGRNNPTKRGK